MSNEILKAIEKGFKKNEIKTILVHYENTIMSAENFYFWSFECTEHFEIEYETYRGLGTFKAEISKINYINIVKDTVYIYLK